MTLCDELFTKTGSGSCYHIASKRPVDKNETTQLVNQRILRLPFGLAKWELGLPNDLPI